MVVAGYDPLTESYDHAVTKKHLQLLKKATDAKGRQLEVHVLTAPTKIDSHYDNADFAAGYIGYYLCNGAVIMQKFSDKQADKAAQRVLSEAFPDREVIALAIDGITAGGGSIHCATQQEPAVNTAGNTERKQQHD